MISRELGPAALEQLATLVEAGRLSAPYTPERIGRFVTKGLKRPAAAALSELTGLGMEPRQLAHTLRLVAAERRETQQVRDGIELVWSGPEVAGSMTRDTGVVVRDLFRSARSSVLLANYAFDRPTNDEARERVQALFAPLIENVQRNPDLRVRMFVNVQRPHPSQPGGGRSDAALLQEFSAGFLSDIWTGRPAPEVFYDPRALLPWDGPRASLHAKCLVVDDEQVLLTSANFTQAAQARNIEAGLLLRNGFIARSLSEQFESLVSAGILARIPRLE